LIQLGIYHLAFDSERGFGHAVLHCTIVIEGDESEASGSSCLLVHHQRSIQDSSELFEKFLEFLLNDILTNTADKDLGSTILFIPWNRAFWINLY